MGSLMSDRLNRYLEKTPQEKQSKPTIAYLAALDHLEEAHPSIAKSILNELRDQRAHLKLIASENFSSYATQLAMGNWLTDKYAEGYAHHRFYAGCENVDSIEELACNELKALFGAECAYVQPHSGADANLVAFWSVIVQRVQAKEVDLLNKKTVDELTPEEYEALRGKLVNQKIMGLSLNSGGHLTHGYRHNISSKMMHAISYDVDPVTHLIDYAALAKQVKQERPLILLAGYSAHPRKLNFARFREIADSVGAVLIVDMAHFSGLVAGKTFTGEFDPVPYAHLITSTTHKTLRGPRGGFVLCKREFEETVNKGCPLVLGGPLPHVLAAKAVAFKEANTPEFRNYAGQVIENAQALATRLKEKGIPLITGGTENHMVIADVSFFGLTGRQAEGVLRDAHLTVNRNAVPNDANGPWYTSGVRIGSPALTTLGMGKDEMYEIADIIISVLGATKPKPMENSEKLSRAGYTIQPKVLEQAIGRVRELLSHYPLYKEIEID